jgi:hypothetical protein
VILLIQMFEGRGHCMALLNLKSAERNGICMSVFRETSLSKGFDVCWTGYDYPGQYP